MAPVPVRITFYTVCVDDRAADERTAAASERVM